MESRQGWECHVAIPHFAFRCPTTPSSFPSVHAFCRCPEETAPISFCHGQNPILGRRLPGNWICGGRGLFCRLRGVYIWMGTVAWSRMPTAGTSDIAISGLTPSTSPRPPDPDWIQTQLLIREVRAQSLMWAASPTRPSLSSPNLVRAFWPAGSTFSGLRARVSRPHE
jgi:hypothetical protein